MKLTSLVFLLISWVSLSSQNFSGDFTENDFLKRKSTKLNYLITTIDSVTKKQVTRTSLIAIYSPKTKIITIQDVETKYKSYVMTDSQNELYTVDANGKEDTVNFVQCKPLRLNDTTLETCDMIYVYNKKGQLIKAVTDTNSMSSMMFTENSYDYAGDSLKHSVSKRFIFYANSISNKYFPEEPEEVEETFFKGSQELSIRKVLNRPSKTITIFKTITENEPKTITSKTYCNDKLILIGTYVFE